MGNEIHIRTNAGFSSGSMSLRNASNEAINEYEILIETFDSSGSRIYGLVFHQTNLSQTHSPLALVPSFKLHGPFNPGEKLPVTGFSPIVSSRCPSSAAITSMYVRHLDGTTSTYLAQRWKTDPAVIAATDHFVFSDCTPPGHQTAFVTLGISQTGKVTSFSTRRGNLAKSVEQCLKQELALWRYAPVFVNGHPSASELNLIVLFSPNQDDWSQIKSRFAAEIAGTVSILDIREDKAVNGWAYGYAANCCLGTVTFHP
jgi:hypothetical protein